MTTKHTPGPWWYGPANDGFLYVYDDDGHAICQIGMADGVFANTRLIAAAPDLLAACERSLARLEYDLDDGTYDCTCAGSDDLCELHALRAAIAKAKGEKP